MARPIVLDNGSSGGSTNLNDYNTTGTTHTYSGVISGTGSYTRNASTNGTGGTTTFTANNTYTGTTTVNRGTLEINNSNSASSGRISGTSGVSINNTGTLLLSGSNSWTDRINNSAGVTINGGGKFNTGGLSEGTRPSSAGASDGVAGMGALTLTGTSSSLKAAIDFTAATGSSLVFSSLSGGSGAFVNILNWTGSLYTDSGATTNDRLLFVTDPGLTQAQLTNWQFFDDSGTAIGVGAIEIAYGGMFEIVPVPEPSTWCAAALAFLAVGYTQRKRFARVLKRA